MLIFEVSNPVTSSVNETAIGIDVFVVLPPSLDEINTCGMVVAGFTNNFQSSVPASLVMLLK